MSEKSSIEWTDASWNPLRGTAGRHTCARISHGCDNCYAATMNKRGLGGTEALDYGQGETLNDPARLDEKALLQPHHWKKPRMVFVCSMTDIAGGWVEREWFHAIWTVMAETPRHTYQVLTKRPSRLRALVRWFQEDAPGFGPYPLPNVWVGTTIESDQYTWRANRLRDTPAAVRWISAEPLLSGLPSLDLTGIDWLVSGGESGSGARPSHPDWYRDLRDRCQTAGVAYFHKQWGEYAPIRPYDDTEGWTNGEVVLNLDGKDWRGSEALFDDGAAVLRRVGRKAAGRLLDGREWNEFPPAAPGTVGEGAAR